MKISNKHFFDRLLLLLVLLLSVAACTPTDPGDTPQPGVTLEVPEVTQELTATPTVTAVPEEPTVLLVISNDADPYLAAQTQAAFQNLVAESSYALITQDELSPDSITPNVAVVVGVGPDLSLVEIAAAVPQTSFAAVDHPDISPTTNLSVIGDPLSEQEQRAFMAGYLAALISEDYKVAALIPSGGEQETMLSDAFVVGAEFFCGACKPLYAPFVAFPQWQSLPVENAASGFQLAIDNFIANGVEVLYVPGLLATPELLTYADEVGLKVVGDQQPDLVRNNWVGTILFDPSSALVSLWENLLAGAAGEQLMGSVTLLDTESGLVSEGRLQLFNEMAADLQAGLVLPRRVP